MSSFPRRMQRKVLRARPDYEPRQQPFKVHKDGGYSTLRPTKGWVKISGKRLKAQRVMARLLGGRVA